MFHISQDHKLLNNDLQLDVSISHRECYYGGHIVKIINVDRVSSFAEQRLKNEYIKLKIPSIELSVGELNVKWDGKDVSISHPDNYEPSYYETAFLLGSQLVYGNKNSVENLGRLPLSISPLDEF